MSLSEPRAGLSSFSGIAIVGQTGTIPKSKTVILDVEVFLGGEKHWTLMGSLRFFNGNNIPFADYPDGLLCMLKASFAQPPGDATLYSGVSQTEHSFIGDVHSITPLGTAPDPQEANPLFNPSVRPFVFLSGLALNRNMDTSSFTLDIDVWVSASKDSSKPSFKPTAPFLCVIPDSPRYKSCGKPVPYNRRFVSVTGTLSSVVYKDPTAQDLEIERFVVNVEDIVFLGQPPESALTPSKQIPNKLDGSTSKARRGFGFFKGTGSSVKRGNADPPVSLAPSAPSTPTPSTKRARVEAQAPSTRRASAALKEKENGAATQASCEDIYV